MTEFDDMKEDVIMNEATICAASTGVQLAPVYNNGKLKYFRLFPGPSERIGE
jgi:hypothetical protein